MRRFLTLFALLLLVPAGAWAQTVGGDYIKYYPPSGIVNALGGFTTPGSPLCISATDACIYRAAANALELRNGANAQAFYVDEANDGAGNYTRQYLGWTAGKPIWAFEAGGTGSLSGDYGIFRFIGFGEWHLTPDWRPGTTDASDLGDATHMVKTAYITRGFQGSKSKSLTDAGAAVSIERVAVPTNGYAGMMTLFTANSTDGTNRLTTSGIVTWAAADTTGTVTCGTPVVTGLVTAYKRANTLVCTFTAVTATTNCDLQVTCTDNLAGSQTMAIEHFPIMPTVNTYTPQ